MWSTARDAGLARRDRGGRSVGCPAADRRRRSADVPAQSAARLLRPSSPISASRKSLGSTFAGSVDALVPALGGRGGLKDLLADELVLIDDATVSLAIEADGRDVTSTWPHRVLYTCPAAGRTSSTGAAIAKRDR